MPFVNPDGYAFTRTTDRMWRKNRNPTTPCSFSTLGRGRGRGVDLNRNYEYQWNTVGSSGDPCSVVHHGTGPFSEPETQAVRDFLMARKEKIIVFNSIHSYSQMVFVPWGYTTTQYSRHEEVMRMANIGNDALKQVHGKNYDVGCIPCLLYHVGGSANDWATYDADIQ